MENRRIHLGLGWIYALALTVSTFTGFGNMPLYKRYYLADLPGFRWIGDFLTNLYVHYAAGAVLLALSVYFLLIYLLNRNERSPLSRCDLLRGIAAALVLSSGLVLAIKNWSGVLFSLPIHISTTIGHLALAMAMVVLWLGCAAARRWRPAGAQKVLSAE